MIASLHGFEFAQRHHDSTYLILTNDSLLSSLLPLFHHHCQALLLLCAIDSAGPDRELLNMAAAKVNKVRGTYNSRGQFHLPSGTVGVLCSSASKSTLQ